MAEPHWSWPQESNENRPHSPLDYPTLVELAPQHRVELVNKAVVDALKEPVLSLQGS